MGFAAGCRLMTGLVEVFWDALFPQPDEDGIVTRVAPISGLSGIGREGTLIQPLRRIVLFHRPDGAPFEFSDYLQSVEVDGLDSAERRQQRLDRGVVSFDVFEKEALAAEAEARKAGKSLFALLRSRAAQATEEWLKLAQILDMRAGADAPPTSRIRELLEQIEAAANRFALPATDAPTEPANAAVEETASIAAASSLPAMSALASREDALRALAQIAEFFRRTEPLSPITYTLQEAVRRSRMTWPELLEEIVPDPASRSAILSSLGIRPPATE